MAVTLDVAYQVLRDARHRWDDAADQLDGARRRLSRASTRDLSAEVAAAVEAFREPWAAELKGTAERAQGHSDDIVWFHQRLVLTDEAHAERIRALLPWAQHDAEIAS